MVATGLVRSLTVDEEFMLSKRQYEQITGRRHQQHEVIACQIHHLKTDICWS